MCSANGAQHSPNPTPHTAQPHIFDLSINYMFDEILTESQAKIITDFKKIKNISLSKIRSFYLSVPDVEDVDYSYYSFSIPATALEDEKVLIKIVEYESGK